MIIELVVITMFLSLALRDVAIKRLSQQTTPHTVLLSIVIANVLVAGIMYFFILDRKEIHSNIPRILNPINLLIVLLGSFLGMAFLYYYYLLIHKENLYYVHSILAIYPAFIVLAGYMFLNETPNFIELIAILLIVIGILMLNTYKK